MIDVQGVRKTFGPTVAVAGVSFSVRKGEVIGLLGPNGSGKTTLIRIITGFFPPSSGRAEVAGLDVQTHSLEIRKRIGYLPELRKVRRISMASRSDAFWGSDGDIDSVFSFNSKIGFWTFKILADKNMLMMASNSHYGKRDIWCAEVGTNAGIKAQLFCNDFELRPIIVIEAVPTGYTQYAFSKRILYYDKEWYVAQVMEGYDHGGKLWKNWQNTFERGTTPKSDAVGNPTWPEKRLIFGHGGWRDFQLDHSSNWDCPDAYLYPNFGIKQYYLDMPRAWNSPETFDVNYLIKSAGF